MTFLSETPLMRQGKSFKILYGKMKKSNVLIFQHNNKRPSKKIHNLIDIAAEVLFNPKPLLD